MEAGALVLLSSVRRAILVGVAVCAALVLCVAGNAQARGVIPTDKGPVRGLETPTVNEYLGIPYAAPPVGALRWRAPQPVARWHGPRQATQFGNHCPQAASPFGLRSETEGCLYLNVFTPNKGPGRGHAKRLPVMFWIHGGAFTVGESDDYDPTRLVEQGVVVVTINYRLGNLGLLAHPALSAESAEGGSGNYGLMDQQAALRWVERNIAKFGGDPQDVTIFGESAGGLSVHSQLASPLAAGLFDGAIAQSGAYALTLPSLEQAESQGTFTAQTVGCADQSAACLRAAPVDKLVAAQPATGMTPNVDGNVLPRSPAAAFSSGEFNRVPVIEGTTHDEFSLFAATNIEAVFGTFAWTPSFYPLVVTTLLSTLGINASASAVIAEYPLGNVQSSAQTVIALATDALFACPGRGAARSLSQFVRTYAYEFNDQNAPQVFIPPASFPFGAYHASELSYLFDSTIRGGHAPLNDDQERLAAAMVRYWTQFARAADPNSAGVPVWPAYTTTNDTYMSLQPPAPKTVTNFAADHHCAFWDAQ